MRIDDRIEPLVREALTAVVKSDAERLGRAFLAFPDDHAMTEGARLATAVALYVLGDVYGRTPTSEELRAVGDKLVEMEDWTDITSDEVVSFLTAAYQGRWADEIVLAGRIAPVAYVVAANLLASCGRKGEWWFTYLDRVETALEEAPGVD